MSYNYKIKPVKQDPLPIPPNIQKIIDDHDKAGLIYIRGALDDQEIAFLDLVNRRPDTHQRYISSIYRLKTHKKFVADQSTDEVIIYHMKEEVKNHLDLYVPLDRERGYWWQKNTRMIRDASGQGTRPQILNDTPVFEIPFKPETVDKLIELSAIGVQNFHVGYAATEGPSIMRGDPSTIKNVEDFKNAEHQELIDMARYNYSTNEPRLDEWRAEGKSIMKQSRTITSLSNANVVNRGNRNV